MLLQFDIQPFLKVSQVIAAVQEKIGIREPFTTGDAIKSVRLMLNIWTNICKKTVTKFTDKLSFTSAFM